MKLTHLLAGTAVAAVAIGAGIKGYVHYRVKSHVDDMIAEARPFVDIRYQGLDVDLSGSATLRGLDILPSQFPDRFRIDALTVTGPDTDFLLYGFGAVKQRGELPRRAAIAVTGLRLRTDGGLVQAMQKSQETIAGILNVPIDSCSLGQVFGSRDFAALGQQELLLDMGFGYSFAESFQGVELHWNFRMPTESGEFRMTLVNVSPALQQAALGMPRLRDLSLSYRLDPASTNQMIDYCAQSRGIDRDAYIQQLVEEPDVVQQLYLGFVPGPGLRQAFQELLRNPGELRASARPIDPLDLTTVGLYNASQLPDLFGLSVEVNKQPVEDLSFTFLDLAAGLDERVRSELENSHFWSGLGAPSAPAPATRAPPSRTNETPRFRATEPSALAEHVGREVRITASGGRKRNGTLKSLVRGVATLEERRHGGVLTTNVAVNEIVNLEVLR